MSFFNRIKCFVVIAFAFVLVANASTFASVKVFQKNKKPLVIDVKTPATLNKGQLAKTVVDFVKTYKDSFGLDKVDGEILELRKASRDERGAHLRFIQRHNRVTIESAELVALTTPGGNLKTINSSLTSTPKITVQPDISRQEALRTATRELGYRDADLGQGKNDGLLIVTTQTGEHLLVWQFSIREKEDGSRAMKVQVIAQGRNAGKIYRAMNIASSVGGPISIYDSSVTLVLPNPIYKGVKVLENGKKTISGYLLISDEAKNANSNFEKIRSFYNDYFSRESYDGNGAKIVASVNVQKHGFLDLLGFKQNAAWMGPWKFFVFGAGGDELAGFTGAMDVVAHEFTHAVIETSSSLTYAGQSGALNEHLADLFGAMIEKHYYNPSNPFLIGDTVLRGDLADKAEALRDMLNPEKGVVPQPSHVDDIAWEFGENCVPNANNDNCGVHVNCGIPNRATALAIKELGWEALHKLFYRVMTVRLLSGSNFKEYREQLLDECSETLKGSDCKEIGKAFDAVGIK